MSRRHEVQDSGEGLVAPRGLVPGPHVSERTILSARIPSGGPSLRVLHLAHIRWFNAEVQYAVDLASCMRHRGHSPAVLTLTGSPTAKAARGAGLETYEERGFNGKGLGALAMLPAAQRLTHLLQGGRFDVVEVHRPEGLPLIVWACRRAGVPVVRVRGEMRPVRNDPFNRLLHSRFLSAVVASNHSIETSLRERLGSLPHLQTIHGGVDPEAFHPEGPSVDLRRELGFPEKAFLVGILGRLGPVKGHSYFLDAAERVLKSGVSAGFVVLAKEDSPGVTSLRDRLAADPLLRTGVRLTGYREDLPQVLRAFDLGVVASVGSEANCRVGLEWMASGVPLLATRVGVLPDLVEDGGTGFLVSAADASALAEKIVYLASRQEVARRFGAAARDRVLERFTLAHCAAAHEALIRELSPR